VNNLHWVMDWEYGNGLSRILPTKWWTSLKCTTFLSCASSF
jgi:hypothetical protein